MQNKTNSFSSKINAKASKFNYLLIVWDLRTKYILTIKFGCDTKAGYDEPHVTRLDSSPSNLFRDTIGPNMTGGS